MAESLLNLTSQGCFTRQSRLREYLEEQKLPAAMLLHPRHVYYFSGWWGGAGCQSVLLITPEFSVLAQPFAGEEAAYVDEVVLFSASHAATLVDDQVAQALDALRGKLRGISTVAVDTASGGLLSCGLRVTNLGPILLKVRRTKMTDEVALIRRAIAGCESAYQWAREHLRPGLSEVDVYASLQAAAVRGVGEPIDEFGNDFQSGTSGGPPRLRAIETGELMPLDLGVCVHGYHADLCRTFCIGSYDQKLWMTTRQ